MTEEGNEEERLRRVKGIVPARAILEQDRLLTEEVKGTIPAMEIIGKGPVQCGIVFATHVVILAYFSSRIANIAGALRAPDYHMMKRAWARFKDHPASQILENKQYKCFIVPHNLITHFAAVERGRIRKNTILRMHLSEQVLTFVCTARLRDVMKDVDDLLRQSGIGFSKGQEGDF